MLCWRKELDGVYVDVQIVIVPGSALESSEAHYKMTADIATSGQHPSLSPGDYEPLEVHNISFGPVAVTGSRQCVNISLPNDNIAELYETFFVELLTVSGPLPIGPTSSASVTILDDDGMLRVRKKSALLNHRLRVGVVKFPCSELRFIG